MVFMSPNTTSKGLSNGANKLCRFLIAILGMDRILAERTTWRVMKTLDNISSQLDDTYEDLVARIRNQQEQDSALGMKVLQWITHAKRPLISCELCHALAVDQGNETEAFSVLDRGEHLLRRLSC